MEIGSRIKPNTQESPFIKHRDVFLDGKYSAARALRGVVLELCESQRNCYACGMGNYDLKHRTILVEIPWWIGEMGAETPGLRDVLKVAWEDWEYAQKRSG